MSTQTQTQVKAPSTPKTTFATVQPGLLQRKCACGGSPGVDGECEECRKKQLSLQRRATNPATPATVPPIVHDVLCSPGQPLDAATRAFMQPRFGHDFSQVRIHTDARAAESARAVNALAYTVGRDVVFGARQYSPETIEGKKLVAHELTHVVQQDSFASTPTSMSSPTDAGEREASRITSGILMEQQARVKPLTSTPLLQRQDAGTRPALDVSTPTQSDAGSSPTSAATPCPTSVRVGATSPFNHSNLSDSDKLKWRTYLGTVSRMDVGPSPNHTGHCMKELLATRKNDCPAALFSRSEGGEVTSKPCTGNRCLDINSGGSAGDGLTHTMLSDGPTAFIDLHRTRNAKSLLEGTGVNSCTTICEQRYFCDRTQATTGVFLITRNYQASTYTPSGGSGIHITTGTVTKTTQAVKP